MAHEHDWLLPTPLWSTNGYRQVEFYQPALFEYQSDEFMEEFLASVSTSTPSALKQARLKPEDGIVKKLFQPAHGRFYLAAASLCCREPGFPSREVRQADGEKVALVLRKLVGGKEYGWVAAGEKKGWRPVNGSARGLLTNADEQRLPAFKVITNDGRPLYCGYVPTSSSETYDLPVSKLDLDPGEVAPDIPVEELDARFKTPLTKNPDTGDSLVDTLPDDVAWTTSVYLLVELWEFLEKYRLDLPGICDAIKEEETSPTFSGDKADELADLFRFLQTQAYKGSLTLAQALKKVADNYTALNAVGGGDLPALGFLKTVYNLKGTTTVSEALDDLMNKVRAALPDERPPLKLPKLDVNSAVRYVLRFIYERPQCEPPEVQVSMPSQPFTFAPFFDPDAPARPVRIPLPSDVSIAGLRKFNKNVTFMMSDAMRKKMESIIGKEKDILDNPDLSEPTDNIAFVCSFSIQIIFLVAFMLLMIFVVVLNIIFWWLAFFKICLPVPKKLMPQ